MKYFILLAGICLLGSFSSSGQSLSNIDTNKYRINLPSYWKPGNKAWKILTDKFPDVCQEIKDKDLCGDQCNPQFTLELEILEPIVMRYDYYCMNVSSNGPTRDWVFLSYYNFQSSFLLLNEKREVLTRFILVDTSETWVVRNTAQISLPGEVSYRSPRTAMGVSTASLVRSQSQSSYLIPVIRYRDNFNPAAYVQSHHRALFPSDLELFAIIDMRIKSW